MTFYNLKYYLFLCLQKLNHLRNQILSNSCIFIITLFRPVLGPLGICPFEIGCTDLAILALQTQPFFIAIYIICKRLLSCNPLSIWLKQHKTIS